MKIRITRVQVVEYEPEPENYEDGTTPEEMFKADMDYAQDMPDEFFEEANDTITGAIIEG